MDDRLLLFWGKARPSAPGSPNFHPALLHCLDVAAAASALSEKGFATGLDRLAPMLPCLAALHDIGKFTRGFQQQCPQHWPESAFGPFRTIGSERHDTTGYWLLRVHCRDEIDALFPGMQQKAIHALLRAIGGHHGRPPREADDGDDPYPPGLCPASAAIAREVARTLIDVLSPTPISGLTRADARRLSWSLAGIVTLADWIGSGPHFPYVDATGITDLHQYFDAHALPRARHAVRMSGLHAAKTRTFTGIASLFPEIAAPSPVQDWASAVELPVGPVLAIIEDSTGSGKTEAALTLAHRLLVDGRADGIFVGLPTMATAGAMFERLKGSYARLFEPGATPSLALSHGRARLDPRFTNTILARTGADDICDDASSASAHCVAWLADGGRKGLLAQVGVGTLDQALLAVLPARHAALRQLALSRKVLIIDEVHAYDHYMRTELQALLRAHATRGGSAILLSATLTVALRQQLIDAFAEGLNARLEPPIKTDYPLVSLASASRLTEQHCLMRPEMMRSAGVRRVTDVAEAVREITAAAGRGAAVAWIRNTVDDAISGARALEEVGVASMLFHARFAMSGRLRIEADVLRRFGKASDDRAGVVVATQVIEQSLDLDFDLVVSDMAPADLLIQRAGRLWRHPGRSERPLQAPELLLIGPEPVETAAADWLSAALPGTAYIYPASLVWRSARALLGAGAIKTPGNVRDLVEAAYDESAPLPAGLESAATKSIGEQYSARSIADMNLLVMKEGYCRSAGAWGTETRTPTRLEDGPTVTLRLARVGGNGQVVPYAPDIPSAQTWALSEVRVSAARVKEAPPPPALQAAAQAARASWGRWEREADEIKLVVLIPEHGILRAGIVDAKGKAGGISYTAAEGLMWC